MFNALAAGIVSTAILAVLVAIPVHAAVYLADRSVGRAPKGAGWLSATLQNVALGCTLLGAVSRTQELLPVAILLLALVLILGSGRPGPWARRVEGTVLVASLLGVLVLLGYRVAAVL